MGLTPQRVVSAGCELADGAGFERLSLVELATKLGVRVPSLYKHIGGVDDLRSRIALESSAGLRRALEEAVHGRQGRAALSALVHGYRDWTHQHPGGYQAMVWATATTEHSDTGDVVGLCLDPLLDRVAVGYGVPSERRPVLVTVMCSMLRGFITLETARLEASSPHGDAALEIIVEMLDHSLAKPMRGRLRRPGPGGAPSGR
jgi:AcrR family transcriptional regulator